MKPVRFGIIGVGNIAQRHAEALASAENAELVAVSSRRFEQAQKFAQRYNVEAAPDLDAMLAREDIDAVTIATPSGAHLDVVRPAARAGKHVLCEKPLEITPERVDQVVEVCRESGVQLACVFQSRLGQNAQRIREALEKGRFGKLLLAGVQMKWYRSQEYYDQGGWRGTWKLDGGGVLMNQAIHVIDLLRHLAGPVEEVFAFGGTLAHERMETEDTAAAVLRFANGAMGTIEASTGCEPGFPRRLEISGERGSIVMEDDRLVRWTFADMTEEDERIAAEGAAGEGLQGGSGDPMAIGHAGHQRLIEDLATAVRTGGKPLIPGEEGRHAVELICGIYDSIRTGQPVKIGG